MVTVTKALSVLKLERPYSAADVKKQFRILALGCHPDKIKIEDGEKRDEDAVEEAKAQFQQLVDAKEILLKSVLTQSIQAKTAKTAKSHSEGFPFNFWADDFEARSGVETPPGTKRVETVQWRCTACELDFKSDRGRKPKPCCIVKDDSLCFCGCPHSSHDAKYGCQTLDCPCESFNFHPQKCDCVCGFPASKHNPVWPRQCDESEQCQTFFPGDWRCPTCGHGWTCHETYTHVEYVRKDPSPKKKKPKLEIPSIDHSAERLLNQLRNFMRDTGPDSLTLMPPAQMAAAGKKKTRPRSANPVRRDATVVDKLKKQQVEFVQKQGDFLKKQAQEAAVRKEARKQKKKKQDATTPRKVDPIRCEPCAPASTTITATSNTASTKYNSTSTSTSNTTSTPATNSTPTSTSNPTQYAPKCERKTSPKKSARPTTLARPKSADARKRNSIGVITKQRPKSADPLGRPAHVTGVTVTSRDRKVPQKWLKQMDDAPVGNRINISIPGVRIVNHSVSPSPRKNDLKSPSNIRELEIAADELLYSARSFVSQDSFVEEDVHLKESGHTSSAVPSTTSSSFVGTSQGISQNPSHDQAKQPKFTAVRADVLLQSGKITMTKSDTSIDPYVFSLDSMQKAVDEMPKRPSSEPFVGNALHARKASTSSSKQKDKTGEEKINKSPKSSNNTSSSKSSKKQESNLKKPAKDSSAEDRIKEAMASYQSFMLESAANEEKEKEQKSYECDGLKSPTHLVWGSSGSSYSLSRDPMPLKQPAHPFNRSSSKNNEEDEYESDFDDYVDDPISERLPENKGHTSYRHRLQMERKAYHEQQYDQYSTTASARDSQQYHSEQEQEKEDDPFSWAPRPEMKDWMKRNPKPAPTYTPPARSSPLGQSVGQWQSGGAQQPLFDPQPQPKPMYESGAPLDRWQEGGPKLYRGARDSGATESLADPGAPQQNRPPRAGEPVTASRPSRAGSRPPPSARESVAPSALSEKSSRIISPRRMEQSGFKARPAVIAAAIAQRHAAKAAAIYCQNRPRAGFASMYSGGPVRATDRSLVPPISDASGHVPPIRKAFNNEPHPSPSPGWIDDGTEEIRMESPMNSRPSTPQRIRAANSPPRRQKEVLRNVWGTPQTTPKLEPRSRPSSASKMRNSSSKSDFTLHGGLFSDLELPSTKNSARHSEAESSYWCNRVEYKPASGRRSCSRPGSATSNRSASQRPMNRSGSAQRQRPANIESSVNSQWSAFDSSQKPCIRPGSPYAAPKIQTVSQKNPRSRDHKEIQQLKHIYSVHVPGYGDSKPKRKKSVARC